jgi:hypothetical protein
MACQFSAAISLNDLFRHEREPELTFHIEMRERDSIPLAWTQLRSLGLQRPNLRGAHRFYGFNES